MTAICLLVAAERSGTHLLRSLLGGTPGIKAPGEVANVASGSIQTEPTSYLKFRKEQFLENPDYFFASRELQARLVTAYLDHIRAIYRDQEYAVLDVKYSHVHNFNASWWDPSLRPFLLEYARVNAIKVIHLVRRKVYRTAISQLYTQESGIYRARDPGAVKELRIEIPRQKLERRAHAIAQTIGMFERWTWQCDRLRITYEALAAERAQTLGELKEFLGLGTDIPKQPKFVKTTPPYKDAIANYNEIADLIDVELAKVRAAATEPPPGAET